MVCGAAAAADTPRPIERPHRTVPADDVMMSNAPVTAVEDLARIEAEIHRQKKARRLLEKERKALQSDSTDLQARAIALAAEVQAQELAVTMSRDNLDVLNQSEAKIMESLQIRRARLGETLAALQLMERQKPPALAVRPDDASEAIHSAILLSDIVPRLKKEADALTNELQDLRLVRNRILEEQETLEDASFALKGEQTLLATVIKEKIKLQSGLNQLSEAQEARLASLGQKAESLTSLIEQLGEETNDMIRPKARPGEREVALLKPSSPAVAKQPKEAFWSSAGAGLNSFHDARGQVRMPAIGKITEKFGTANQSGGSTKGIKINTLPGAHVVAPYDGRVKYSGALRTYGQVLIVEAGGDYLIIMAGLNRVDVKVGQLILAGEPVGQMATVGEEGPRELYLEFRRAREPFDPLPWLASVTTKEG